MPSVPETNTQVLEDLISKILKIDKDLSPADVFTRLSGENPESSFTKNQVKHCLKRLKGKQQAETDTKTSCYEVRDLSEQSKGLGAIATRAINFGEEICRDSILMKVSSAEILGDSNSEHAQEWTTRIELLSQKLEKGHDEKSSRIDLSTKQDAMFRRLRPMITWELFEEKVYDADSHDAFDKAHFCKDKFFKLHDGSYKDEAHTELESHSGRFWSNSFPGPPVDDLEADGVFPKNSSENILHTTDDPDENTVVCFESLSRFNHSCDPNALFAWRIGGRDEKGKKKNDPRWEGVIVAIRDIEVGEEICICYADWREGVWNRLEILEAGYGFRCDCSRCIAEISEEIDIMNKSKEESSIRFRGMTITKQRLHIMHMEKLLADLEVRGLSDEEADAEVDRVLKPYVECDEDLIGGSSIPMRLLDFHSSFIAEKEIQKKKAVSPMAFLLEIVHELLEAYASFGEHLKYTDENFGMFLSNAVWCSVQLNNRLGDTAGASSLKQDDDPDYKRVTRANMEKLCRECYKFWMLVKGPGNKFAKLSKGWIQDEFWDQIVDG